MPATSHARAARAGASHASAANTRGSHAGDATAAATAIDATSSNGANWVAVASADHIAIGRSGGFMQVGHGKGAPLKRLHAGDRVAFYSPVRTFGTRSPCQAFTAVGTVRDERIYQAEMADGFQPFRRDVDWLEGTEAPIQPLLATLSFTHGKANWGYSFRFGLFKVTAADIDAIIAAMQARAPTVA